MAATERFNSCNCNIAKLAIGHNSRTRLIDRVDNVLFVTEGMRERVVPITQMHGAYSSTHPLRQPRW